MPEPDESPLEPLPAEAATLKNKLHSLGSLDIAISGAIADENHDAALQFARIARARAGGAGGGAGVRRAAACGT